MNLKEIKINIESLLKEKLQEFQDIENQRNQTSAEILKLQGKLELIEEQIKDTPKEEIKEDSEKK